MSNKAKLTTTLTPATLQKLETLATCNGLRINQVIEILVQKQKKSKLF